MHSTIHQIEGIVKFVKLNKSQLKSIGHYFSGYRNIEKAFGNLWHNSPVFKLNNFGYPMFIQKF